MKVLYMPINNTADELLKKTGFVESLTKGYVLKKNAEPKRGSTAQYHAIVQLDGAIDIHADIFDENGRHVTNKSRVHWIRDIIRDIDMGIIPKTTKKQEKSYPSMVEKIKEFEDEEVTKGDEDYHEAKDMGLI